MNRSIDRVGFEKPEDYATSFFNTTRGTAFRDHRQKGWHTLMMNVVTSIQRGMGSPLGEHSLTDLVDTMLRLRERATYVCCVMGQERWSSPARVIERDTALANLRWVLTLLVPIMSPKRIAAAVGGDDNLEPLTGPGRLRPLALWGESPEGQSLSEALLAETKDWFNRMAMRLGLPAI